MTLSNPTLAALIGSRICHDLISPIGAINNGLELMALDGAPLGPELALINESCASANARIRFFRVAYGAAGEGGGVGAADLRGILDGMFGGGRLRVDWAASGITPRGAVQLVFLAIQCLESALPQGGCIRVVPLGEGWQLSVTEGRVAADPALWDRLARSDAPGDISAAHVQFALLPILARDAGMAARPLPEGDAFGLTIRPV